MNGCHKWAGTLLRKIEYARRQAVDAYAHASEAMDNGLREEWLEAARMWEELVRHYELLIRSSETESG